MHLSIERTTSQGLHTNDLSKDFFRRTKDEVPLVFNISQLSTKIFRYRSQYLLISIFGKGKGR